MTYEENVRKVAEEMAISNFKEFTTSFIAENTWDSLDDYGKELSIESCMESARIAIDLSAKEVRHAMQPYRSNGFITNLLIERGLIPAPEPALDHDPDTCMHSRVNMEYCMDCGDRI